MTAGSARARLFRWDAGAPQRIIRIDELSPSLSEARETNAYCVSAMRQGVASCFIEVVRNARNRKELVRTEYSNDDFGPRWLIFDFVAQVYDVTIEPSVDNAPVGADKVTYLFAREGAASV
jgi:hypothetical protein